MKKYSPPDKLINDAYELVLSGFTANEIMRKLYLNENHWKSIHSTARFHKLLRSGDRTPNSVKLKEIENNLFYLLELQEKNPDINRRIKYLTNRYATFLI